MLNREPLSDRLFRVIISYAVIVISTALLWYGITKLVLLQLPGLPSDVRQGYDNPFLSLLGLVAVFLFGAYILYAVITAMLPKSASLFLKMLVGFIAGVLPVVVLQLSTFGLPLSNPAVVTELAIMGLGGAALPLFQRQTPQHGI